MVKYWLLCQLIEVAGENTIYLQLHMEGAQVKVYMGCTTHLLDEERELLRETSTIT